MNNLKKISLILLGSVLASTTYADSSCGELIVEITNATSGVCVRDTVWDLKHGEFLTSPNYPPSTINPHMIANFKLGQRAGFGPDLQVTYHCQSGAAVTFDSQQDFCILKAGKITGKVISSDPGIHASYKALEGSYSNYGGVIQWTLSA